MTEIEKAIDSKTINTLTANLFLVSKLVSFLSAVSISFAIMS